MRLNIAPLYFAKNLADSKRVKIREFHESMSESNHEKVLWKKEIVNKYRKIGFEGRSGISRQNREETWYWKQEDYRFL